MSEPRILARANAAQPAATHQQTKRKPLRSSAAPAQPLRQANSHRALCGKNRSRCTDPFPDRGKPVDGALLFSRHALVRLEAAAFVGSVAEGSVGRRAAAAQRDRRFLGIERVLFACGVGQGERALHEEGAVGSHADFNLVCHEVDYFRERAFG